MSAVEDILEHVRRHGGILVRARSRADGDEGDDAIAPDLLLSDHTIAYVSAGTERAHAFHVRAIEVAGDEWNVTLGHDTRFDLVLSPMWLEAHDQYAAQWRKRPEDARTSEMRRLFDVLERAPHAEAPPEPPITRFRCSWFAKSDADGALRTIGVLIGNDRELQLHTMGGEGHPIATGWNDKLRRALRNMSPKECFERLTEEGGNGITISWSVPFDFEATSSRAAAQELLRQLVQWRAGIGPPPAGTSADSGP